jgi:hypothetical protein
MEFIKKYICCCCNFNNSIDIEKFTKDVEIQVTEQNDVKHFVNVKHINVDVSNNESIKSPTSNYDFNDDFNVVTNEDYGDIQPDNTTNNNTISDDNTNKIIFASSSIKNYFKND